MHGLEIAGALEAAEVLAGGVKPVGVVDPESGDDALADEAKDKSVCLREDARVLHPDGRQLVDVEEASVVDLLPCDTPGGEPVDLVVEKPVQEIEAPRVAGGAVEEPHVLGDKVADVARCLQEPRELLVGDLRLPMARGQPLGIRLRAVGNREQQLVDVLQLEQGRVLGPQRGLELVQPVTENLDVRPRRHRQNRVVVVNREASIGELQA